MKTTPSASLLAGAVLAILSLNQPAKAQVTLPADAKPTCIVSAAELANWFASGSVTPNGTVDPADSVTFPDVPNCPFYKWSLQMFLWLTSPAPPKLAKTGFVFESSVFYDVSPPDASGMRTLIPNAPGQMRSFSVSIPQRGPLNMPVGFDKTGKMFTIVRPEAGPTGKAAVRTKAGAKVEIERTQVAPDGKPLFLDKAGRPIDPQVTSTGNPRLFDPSGKRIDLQTKTVVLSGKRFFLNAAGQAVDVEQGQADGNVLMAQGGSLVYYAMQVNDIFAYFLTGAKNGGITPAPMQFPTTAADLNKVTAFGSAHGKTFPHPNALAIEVKSSWIEATGLDASKYVTIAATIPTYDTSNPELWVPNGSKQAQLALVGIHVVGSTAGHPEMIWATFEHVNNTPNEQYSYRDAADTIRTAPKTTTGTWLFSESSSTGTPNSPRMAKSGSNIMAEAGKTIGPSNILRSNPWGTAASNPQAATNNTDLISINSSVMGMLAAGDVRKNYLLTGSTWTIGGAAPGSGNQVGTSQSANPTMETFLQQSNCFSCHRSNRVGVSHIYNDLKPLFP